MIVVLFLNMVWSEMITLFGKCSRRHFHSACNGLENIILYIFILCQCQVHKSTAEKVIVCGVQFFQHHIPQKANVCKVQSQMSRLVTMFVNNCQICKDTFLYSEKKMQYCMAPPSWKEICCLLIFNALFKINNYVLVNSMARMSCPPRHLIIYQKTLKQKYNHFQCRLSIVLPTKVFGGKPIPVLIKTSRQHLFPFQHLMG